MLPGRWNRVSGGARLWADSARQREWVEPCPVGGETVGVAVRYLSSADVDFREAYGPRFLALHAPGERRLIPVAVRVEGEERVSGHATVVPDRLAEKAPSKRAYLLRLKSRGREGNFGVRQPQQLVAVPSPVRNLPCVFQGKENEWHVLAPVGGVQSLRHHLEVAAVEERRDQDAPTDPRSRHGNGGRFCGLEI